MAYNPQPNNGQATMANSLPIVLASDQTPVSMSIITGSAPHAFSGSLWHIDAFFNTAQTSQIIRSGSVGKRFAVTDLTVATGGTTAGVVTIYETGSTGTTTPAFVANTNAAIFRGEFAPSTTAKPGVVKIFPIPYVAQSGSTAIRLTTSAAITVYVQMNGYEFV